MGVLKHEHKPARKLMALRAALVTARESLRLPVWCYFHRLVAADARVQVLMCHVSGSISGHHFWKTSPLQNNCG